MRRTETFSKQGFLEEMALEWSLKNQEGFRRVKWSREENFSPGERETEAWRWEWQRLWGSRSSAQRPEYAVPSEPTRAPTPELPKALPVPDPELY